MRTDRIHICSKKRIHKTLYLQMTEKSLKKKKECKILVWEYMSCCSAWLHFFTGKQGLQRNTTSSPPEGYHGRAQGFSVQVRHPNDSCGAAQPPTQWALTSDGSGVVGSSCYGHKGVGVGLHHRLGQPTLQLLFTLAKLSVASQPTGVNGATLWREIVKLLLPDFTKLSRLCSSLVEVLKNILLSLSFHIHFLCIKLFNAKVSHTLLEYWRG